MFNLIVKHSRWKPNRDSISASRVLGYTSDELANLYASSTGPRYDLLKELPTIFAEETDRSRPEQYAFVGRIIATHHAANGDVSIEYIPDPNVPPIPQEMLIEIAPELNIDMHGRGWTELESTHWAVKNVDLYKTLFLRLRSSTRMPSVFSLQEPQNIDRQQVSAMMPFAGFGPVYDAIKNAASANGMKCNRADDIWEHHAIIQDIVSLIDRSAIVVCDCTGRNPNVFYEIGIAHSLGKDVVLIAQDRSDVPFDVAHLRYIKYLNNGEGLQALERELSARIASLKTKS